MKIKSIHLKNFKRFTDLRIEKIPETAKLVVMIGPNGCGKSSIFDALNCYTYIIINDAYPSDDTYVDPFEPGHMMNYYLKNDQPNPYLQMSPEDIASRGMEVGKTILADCVDVILYHEQETKADELRVHTRSSFRSYSFLFSSDLLSSLSVERLQLKLRRLPTEKEVDYMYALNHWMLFIYGIAHQAWVAVLPRDSQPVLPLELKQYAETVSSFKDEILEETINAMTRLFTDSKSALILKNRLQFNLETGMNSSGSFLNPSTGEIAGFDLLLDVIIKKVIDDETIICIDEPELHIHTKLQGQLLEELYNLISPKSQLWIATHSIGMVRKAQDLWREDPESVVFLDFSNRNFDEQVTLKPITPDPDFWARTYEIALGDIAELVVTERTVFCEGEEFDEECYRNIFKDRYPEVRFISLGGRGNVEKSLEALNRVIGEIARNAKVIGIIDRDKATDGEIKRNAKKGIRTLSRKTIESYLLDDEVLTKLCEDYGASDKINDLLAAKQDALDKNKLKSSDNLKPIVQQIHGAVQKALNSANLGNTREGFMMDVLAPRIQPGMTVYEELHKDIFGE